MCRHYRAECQVLEQEWAEILQNCQYMQALPLATIDKYKAATGKLAAIVDTLNTLEQSEENASGNQVLHGILYNGIEVIFIMM